MYLKIKVTPKNKKESVERKAPDEFVIMVREDTKHNQANRRVLEILARELAVEIRDLKLLTGATSRNKIIELIDRKA